VSLIAEVATTIGTIPSDGGKGKPLTDAREKHSLARIDFNIPRRDDYFNWYCRGQNSICNVPLIAAIAE